MFAIVENQDFTYTGWIFLEYSVCSNSSKDVFCEGKQKKIYDKTKRIQGGSFQSQLLLSPSDKLLLPLFGHDLCWLILTNSLQTSRPYLSPSPPPPPRL